MDVYTQVWKVYWFFSMFDPGESMCFVRSCWVQIVDGKNMTVT